MQSTPRCFFLFLLFFIVVVVFPPFIFPLRPVNVQFPPLPYCAITLPKNDFKTYFITTCKYQRCPNTVAKKIYKCCFILFFFHFLNNYDDVYVMYCLPVGCNNKKIQVAEKKICACFLPVKPFAKMYFFFLSKKSCIKGLKLNIVT